MFGKKTTRRCPFAARVDTQLIEPLGEIDTEMPVPIVKVKPGKYLPGERLLRQMNKDRAKARPRPAPRSSASSARSRQSITQLMSDLGL